MESGDSQGDWFPKDSLNAINLTSVDRLRLKHDLERKRFVGSHSDLVSSFIFLNLRIADVIKLNGMAHIVINVSRWQECKIFYKQLMPFLGMEQGFDGEEYIYFVGGRTALGKRKGTTSVDKNKIIEIAKLIHKIPNDFNRLTPQDKTSTSSIASEFPILSIPICVNCLNLPF